MKILQIIQRFYPSVGGSQYHVYMIAKELIKLGHEVTVLTTNSLNNVDVRGFSTGRKFTLKSNFINIPRFEVIDGIKIYRFQPIFQIWTYLINPEMFKFLLENAEKYDIVHAHCYMFAEPDMTAFAARLKNIPFILTGHDIVAAYQGFFTPIKLLYDKTIGKFTLNSVKCAIALTKENEKQYIELGVPKGKIKIIPNGVDYKKFENGDERAILNKIGNPEHMVLCVARGDRYKGIHHIIKAIPEIVNEYHNTKFVFVGPMNDYAYKEELLKTAKDLNVLNYCIFSGYVEDRELPDYYAAADAFVLPSTGEGFGIVALESIASGTPVILADYGGLRYILKDIGGYPLNMTKDVPKQIAEHVKYIFTNTNKVKAEVEKQREIIKERYTWERIAKMTEEVYKEVLKR